MGSCKRFSQALSVLETVPFCAFLRGKLPFSRVSDPPLFKRRSRKAEKMYSIDVIGYLDDLSNQALQTGQSSSQYTWNYAILAVFRKSVLWHCFTLFEWTLLRFRHKTGQTNLVCKEQWFDTCSHIKTPFLREKAQKLRKMSFFD